MNPTKVFLNHHLSSRPLPAASAVSMVPRQLAPNRWFIEVRGKLWSLLCDSSEALKCKMSLNWWMERGKAEPGRWRHMSLSKVMRDSACCPATLTQRLRWGTFITEVGRIRNHIFCRVDAYGYCILEWVQLHHGWDKCLLPAYARPTLQLHMTE